MITIRIITATFILCTYLWSLSLEEIKWIQISEQNLDTWSVSVKSDIEINIKSKQMPTNYKILGIIPKPSSAYNIAVNKILEVFDEKDILVDIKLVLLDKKKINKQSLKTILKDKYDLVLPIGSSATAFMYDNFRGHQTTMLSVCSKDPVLLGQTISYDMGSGNNFAFTSLNVPIDIQVDYIKMVAPQIENVVILYASDNKSAVLTQVTPLSVALRGEKVRVFGLAVEDRSKAKEELRMKIPQMIAKLDRLGSNGKNTLFWITGSTSVFKEIETIDKLASYYGIPVLSVVPNVVKAGDESAVLSIGISFESNAYKAALYAIDLLQKKVKSADLPVGLVSPPDVAINFKKVKNFKMRIPFDIFEIATTIYDEKGILVKKDGKVLK